MAGAFVQSWEGPDSSGNFTTVTVSGATANNLLVAAIANRNDVGTYDAVTGWTKFQEYTGYDTNGSVWYRIASGDSSDNFSPTWTNAVRMNVLVAEYSGLATASPLEASNDNETYVGSTTTSIGTNSATATQATGTAVAFLMVYGAQNWNTVSLTTGSLEASGTSANNYPECRIGSANYTSAGAKSDTWTTTDSGFGGSYAAIGVFKAAAAGAVTVTPNELTHAQTLDNATLTQEHTLAPNALDQAQTLDQPTLTQAHTLAPNAMDQAQTLDNTTLTEAGAISAAELTQAQTLDQPTLTQAHIIAPAELLQAQILDQPTLTQAHILAVAELAQGQSLDAPTLTQAHILAPDALDQAQTLENITLGVAGVLAVQRLNNAQALDQPALTQAHTLTPNAMDQAQALDLPTLVQHYQLTVADLLQAQSLDNVTLTVGGVNIAPNDLAQAQPVDGVTLTQYHVLAVNDLTLAQVLDAVTFGGLVVGNLQGTLTIFATIDGTVVSFPTLDGTVKTLH